MRFRLVITLAALLLTVVAAGTYFTRVATATPELPGGFYLAEDNRHQIGIFPSNLAKNFVPLPWALSAKGTKLIWYSDQEWMEPYIRVAINHWTNRISYLKWEEYSGTSTDPLVSEVVEDPYEIFSSDHTMGEIIHHMVFLKSLNYQDQLEFRFVVWTEEEFVNLEVSMAMLGAMKEAPTSMSA